MNRLVFALVVCSCGLISFSDDGISTDPVALKKELSGKVKITSINESTLRDKNEKWEVFKFGTYQDEDSKLLYRVRVTIELTDKEGATYFAQLAREQGPVHPDYTGEDRWEFHIPHNKLDRLKITAYAIQYGVFEEGVFVPVAEVFSKVKSAEEITARTKERIDVSKSTHSYSYRETDGEVSTSTPN